MRVLSYPRSELDLLFFQFLVSNRYRRGGGARRIGDRRFGLRWRASARASRHLCVVHCASVGVPVAELLDFIAY